MSEPRYPATPTRRSEARARGQVAVSPLGCAAAGLTIAAITLGGDPLQGREALRELATSSLGGTLSLSQAGPLAAGVMLRAALPVLCVTGLASAAIGLLQTRGLWASDPPGDAGPEPAARPVVAWGIVAAAAVLVVRAAPAVLSGLVRASAVSDVLRVLAGSGGALALRIGALLWAGAVTDLLLRRRQLDRALRMTREALLREQRSEQGDPRLRGALRRAGQWDGPAPDAGILGDEAPVARHDPQRRTES